MKKVFIFIFALVLLFNCFNYEASALSCGSDGSCPVKYNISVDSSTGKCFCLPKVAVDTVNDQNKLNSSNKNLFGEVFKLIIALFGVSSVFVFSFEFFKLKTSKNIDVKKVNFFKKNLFISGVASAVFIILYIIALIFVK